MWDHTTVVLTFDVWVLRCGVRIVVCWGLLGDVLRVIGLIFGLCVIERILVRG